MKIQPITFAICFFACIGSVNAQFTTVINVPPDVAPEFIGSDTQLNLLTGGVLAGNADDIFFAGSPAGTSQNVELNILGGEAQLLDVYAGATVNMAGGTLEDFFTFDGGIMNISGGLVFSIFNNVGQGSLVNVSGGVLGGINSERMSELNISGGSMVGSVNVQGLSKITGGFFNQSAFSSFPIRTLEGSSVSIFGGVFEGGPVTVTEGSSLTIAGGILSALDFSHLGDVSLIGSEFFVDGAPIAGLDETGDTILLPIPDYVLLTGAFANGDPINLQLLPDAPIGSRQRASIRFILVPEPTAAALALSALLLIAHRRRPQLHPA